MKVLSNYTHARYCTDKADLVTGIEEIRKKIKELNRHEKKIPSYFYARLNKLELKLELLAKNELNELNELI